MDVAIKEAEKVRCITSPNPWVGCVIVAEDGSIFTGATYEIDRMHAETVALSRAGSKAKGATVYVTLEPCSHEGRTPPCAKSLIDAGVKKVFISIEDVDNRVSGRGVEMLRSAGIEVEVGLREQDVRKQLEPYIYQRKNLRPFVILKMAMTIDGKITSDNDNKYLTSELSLRDVHKLRAESDAILVGANTVRVDNPKLNVRLYEDYFGNSEELNPKRIVLGSVDSQAKVNACETYSGDINSLLDELGSKGVLQLLVEGGANVARQFNDQNLVNEYIFYVAPKVLNSKGLGVFGDLEPNIFDHLSNCDISLIERIGPDIKIVFRNKVE
ncbi:MAG: bifunctional diaminohydroxyphosphoribosylaminopyrimidine deaminase/5-amino-6-(5-phosphoribosylamino)uracil reductase RibD [Acidimicrobiia bacterium]